MSETTPAWLAERLKKEGEKVVAYFATLSDEQWRSEVYTEGDTWTIRNVLAHFVTSERGLLKLFKNIREGGLGASEDFSIDHYNARQQEKTKDLTPQELLEQFVDVRADTANWVSALSEDDLAKEGRHPYLGQVQLVEMLKMIYLHNQIHFRDFRKQVE
ncbi:MAG: DinB family protein [Anaerolineales bacterium]|nr:DinB family protein [Anaerolineales bacterium]